MINTCAVPNCKNSTLTNPQEKLYPFPCHKPVLLEQWLKAIGRNNWKPTRTVGICSIHFQKTDLINNKLKPGTIPKLILPTSKETNVSLNKSEMWEPQIKVFYKDPTAIQTGPDPLSFPEQTEVKEESSNELNLLSDIKTEENELESGHFMSDTNDFGNIRVKEEPVDVFEASENQLIKIKSEPVDYPMGNHSLEEITIKEEPVNEHFEQEYNLHTTGGPVNAITTNSVIPSILIHDADSDLRKKLPKTSNSLNQRNKISEPNTNCVDVADDELKQLRHQVMIETHKLRILSHIYKKLKKEVDDELKIRREKDPLIRKWLIKIRENEMEIKRYENIIKMYNFQFRQRRRQYLLKKSKIRNKS